jgi:hypothetical protein
MRSIAAVLACLFALFGAGPALAQTPPGEKPVTKSKPSTQKPAAPKPAGQAAKPGAPKVVMPDAEKIVLLLRTTLITLNDAMQTGNFTVLRAMGAPGFRDANTAARLAQSFADLGSKGIDLSPTSVIAPQLTEAPGLDQAKGMLRLKGYFPGQPVQINFEMLFRGGRRPLASVRIVGESGAGGCGAIGAGGSEHASARPGAIVAKGP